MEHLSQVVIGFIPYVGQVADVRDISEDVLNWEWSWEHFSYTVLDSIAIIPGFDCLKGLKHTDELYVIVKRGEKEMLLLIDKVDDVTKKLLKGDKIIGYAAKNGDEIITAGIKESKKTVGEIVKENADEVVESGSNFKGQIYNGRRNPDIDFVNGKGKSTLNKHAGKHGYTSPEEYLKDARNFLEKKTTSTIQSFVSNEGTYFRYDIATNEFGIINEYGGISTYFKLENGMSYWLEQIEKYAPK